MSEQINSRRQKLSIIYGILCLVVVLVIMQLWLLTATMNAFLGGDHAIVWPALVGSGLCLAMNIILLRYLILLD